MNCSNAGHVRSIEVGVLVAWCASLFLGACGADTGGGRPAYRETETVVVTVPGHEDVRFGGRAAIGLFKDLESGREMADLEVTATNWPATTGVFLHGGFDLGLAAPLLEGETINVQREDSGIGYSGPGGEHGPSVDPSAFGSVQTLQLSLDETTATSTLRVRLVDGREILIRGQIRVVCSIQDAVGTKDDPRWESPFCAAQRASMNVEPFLTAMR